MGKLRNILGLGPSKAEQIVELRHAVDSQRARERRKAHSSGVDITYGRFEIEQNLQMLGSQKWLTLDKMENDPHVKAAIRSQTLPLLNAEWEITPASDKPRDVEIAEFVAANLLREPSDKYGREFWCQSSWRQRLGEHLRAVRDGYSISSLSMRAVGSKMVYDKIHWLEPASVDAHGWVLDDDDNLISIERTYSTAGSDRYRYQEPLDAGSVAMFVHEMLGARFEGRPLVRAMYGAWYRKDFMLRQAAIWAQKVGAPSPMGFYPGGWPTEHVEAFEKFVKNERGSAAAENYLMVPVGADGIKPEITHAGASTGDVDRMRGLIDGENKEIGHGGGRISDMLGETNTGARSVGEVQSKSEMGEVSALAKTFCDQFNDGPANLSGLVERLVAINFAGVKSYPQLTCSRISADEGLEHFGEITDAWAKGIIPKVPAARRQIVAKLGIELADEDYEVEELAPPPVPPPGNGVPPSGTASPPGGGEPQEVAARAAGRDLEAFRKRIAPLLEPTEGRSAGGNFRAPNQLELRAVDLATVQEAFRVGERDVLTVLRAIRAEMVADLMGRLKAGKITRRNLDGQRRSAFKRAAMGRKRLRRAFDAIAVQGFDHVADELARQSEVVDAA